MEALGKWQGKLPKETQDNIHNLAPMLAELGKCSFSINLQSRRMTC
jgi:hypothetical protein